MGCASSKKQTSSVDDIPKAVEKAGAKPSQPSAPTNKSKNGQVTANANDTKSATPPLRKEEVKPTAAAPPATSPSDAIQIPGAHKSFLAPDGIPFIDEDVDDEIETGRPDGDSSSIPVVGGTVVVKPDVNKNVVKEPASPPKPPAQPSVAPVKTPTVVAAAERRPDDQPTPAQQQQQQQPSEQDKNWAAAIDVLNSDLQFSAQPVVEQTSTTHVTETHSSVTVTTITTTSTSNVDHEVEPVAPQVTDEQQQAAAVKIQAGIRGYRDRQRVKAIRAAKLSHADESAAITEEADHHQQSSELNAAVKTEEIILQEQPGQAAEQNEEQDTNELLDDDDEDDPEKQRAAVKIQASYKGWKTRKELGKVKE